jgi:hypothetical protein
VALPPAASPPRRRTASRPSSPGRKPRPSTTRPRPPRRCRPTTNSDRRQHLRPGRPGLLQPDRAQRQDDHRPPRQLPAHRPDPRLHRRRPRHRRRDDGDLYRSAHSDGREPHLLHRGERDGRRGVLHDDDDGELRRPHPQPLSRSG